MDRLQAIEVFVKVAELKSFSAAADTLNLSRTLVSERVKDLEEALGVRLLQRTTRRVSLTEPGAAFLERVRLGLAALDEAAAEASSLSAEPRGTLRVNAPMSFGFHHVAPVTGKFMLQHPAVRIELALTDRLIDLIEDKAERGRRHACLSQRAESLVAGGQFARGVIGTLSEQACAVSGPQRTPIRSAFWFGRSNLQEFQGRKWWARQGSNL